MTSVSSAPGLTSLPPSELPKPLGADRGTWTFGAGLARVFDDHVRRSIPGYAELHDACLALVVPMLNAGDRVYDLGCSTGEFTSRLAAEAPEASVVGVDGEPEMIAEARLRQRSERYVCADLSRFAFEPARAASLLYVLQFLPVSERKALLVRLRSALGTGGRLILAEKVRFNDPLTQGRVDREYRAFKLVQGFTPSEIDTKARKLEGVLLPMTEHENETLLREAGFLAVRPFFRALCFTAWAAET